MSSTILTDNERILETLQRRLDEEKDYGGFACRECQFEGYGFTVPPESMMKKYESSRDCPDEVYWAVRTWDETAEELEDEDGVIDEPEQTYDTMDFFCEGHAPDCNGVCDYNLLVRLKNQEESVVLD